MYLLKSRLRMAKTWVSLALLILLACGIAGCQTTAAVGYKPPFLPIKFVIDTNGDISIEGDASLATPVGEFSVSLGVSSASSVQPADDSILLVIRHHVGDQIVDSAYQINSGQNEFVVVLDGEITLRITNRRITVDATSGQVKSIQLQQADATQPVATLAVKPTATPTRAPSPGTVLYRANWSSGMQGWIGGTQWKTVDGILVSDGTGANTSLDGSDESMAVLAPYHPEVANYAVQAEIRVGPCVGNYPYGCDAGLGLIARLTSDATGYIGGLDYIHWPDFPSVADLHTDDAQSGPDFGNDLGHRNFDPGNGWHTYRLEVRSNHLTLKIDGATYIQATDNRYLDPGQVGLEGYICQLEVRTFMIVAL